MVFQFLVGTPCGMQDLSSLTRDQSHTSCTGSAVLTTGPAGKWVVAVQLLSHVWLLATFRINIMNEKQVDTMYC